MKGMNRFQMDLTNEAIRAVITAYIDLNETTFAEALRKTEYGKGDTLGLDATPEIAIYNRLNGYDNSLILVTEEQDANGLAKWPLSTRMQ